MKTWGSCFRPCALSSGVVLLALFAFTSVSRADFTVADNLDGNSAKISGYTASGGAGTEFKAQMFTTGSEGGDISLLDLYLSVYGISGTPTMNVYVYDVTGGSISSSPIDLLGTVAFTSATSNSFEVDIENTIYLSPDTDYAIAIDAKALNSGSATVGWAFFSAAVTGINFSGDGTMPPASSPGVTGNNGDYTPAGPSHGSGGLDVTWGILQSQQRLLDIHLVPVPEPTTGAIIGISALCLAAGRTLRRRI